MRARRIVTLSFKEANRVAKTRGLEVTRFYPERSDIWRFAKRGIRRRGIIYDSVNFKKRVAWGDWQDADDIYIVIGEALTQIIKARARKMGLPTRRLTVVYSS